MEEFKGSKGRWLYNEKTGTIRAEGGLLAELLINGREDDNGRIMAAAPTCSKPCNAFFMTTKNWLIQVMQVAGELKINQLARKRFKPSPKHSVRNSYEEINASD